MYKVELEKFSGPLDLLLSLIEKEKLDITQISLAKITDGYLNELSNLNYSGDEMAEFVLVASKLLYLKSKELLPNAETEEEEQEIIDLEARLLEYQKYKEAAKEFEKILAEANRSYKRRATNEKTITFLPPNGINQKLLFAIFEEAIAKTAEPEKEEKEIEKISINIEDKKSHILAQIKKSHRVSFKKLLSTAKHKIEIIVTFLAILEMVKQKEVKVSQDKNFADFVIEGL